MALDSPRVDPFTLVVVVGLAALVLVFWLLGRYYPGSGLEQLGLQSRGEREVSAEELEAEVLRVRDEAQRRWPAA